MGNLRNRISQITTKNVCIGVTCTQSFQSESGRLRTVVKIPKALVSMHIFDIWDRFHAETNASGCVAQLDGMYVLVPALGIPLAITRQVIPFSIQMTLRTSDLLEAAHHYSVHRMHGCSFTPSPAAPQQGSDSQAT